MKLTKMATVIAIILVICFSGFYIVEANSTTSNGSTIGGINVEGMNDKEAKIAIQEGIDRWKKGETVKASSDYETIKIPRASFTFDVNSSLKELNEKTKRKWTSFFMKPPKVDIPLHVNVHLEDEWNERINKEATLERARNDAAMLGKGKVEIKYDKDPVKELKVIKEVKYNVSAFSNVGLEHLVKHFGEVQIKPNSELSFIETAKIPKGLRKLQKEQDFFATILYSLTLKTDLEIIEHHSQKVVPSYSEAGVEAKVHIKDKKDLKVKNNNDLGYIVQISQKNDTLTATLKALPIDEKYDYKLSNRQKINSQTVYRFSPKLDVGETILLQSGRDGTKVDLYRQSFDKKGQLKDLELIKRAIYPARPKIVLLSSAEVEEDLDDSEDEFSEYSQSVEDFINTWYQEPNIDLFENLDINKGNQPYIDPDKKSVNPNTPVIPKVDDGKLEDLPNLNKFIDQLVEEYCKGIEELEEKEEKKENKKEKPKAEKEKENSKEKTLQNDSKIKNNDNGQEDPDESLKILESLLEEQEEKRRQTCSNEKDDLEIFLKKFLLSEQLLHDKSEVFQ